MHDHCRHHGHSHDHSHGHSHSHSHGHHGERGTRLVFWITMATMAAEIAAGWAFGSMALLADGWHMASHAGAMAVAWFAYIFARRHAHNPDFVFGSGKVNALAGFASAVGLTLVAAYMAAESVSRLFTPVPIDFGWALAVAVIGLSVNMGSAWLLRDEHGAHAKDHNLKAAYIHVLADALTSVAAILALLGGSSLGWAWLDPAMGVVGSLVVGRWAWGLLRDTGKVLLDHTLEKALLDELRRRVEHGGQVSVRHMSAWSIGPGRMALMFTVEDSSPRPPEFYKSLLDGVEGLDRIAVEVHACPCPMER